MMIRRTAAIGGTTDTRDHSTAVGAVGSLFATQDDISRFVEPRQTANILTKIDSKNSYFPHRSAPPDSELPNARRRGGPFRNLTDDVLAARLTEVL